MGRAAAMIALAATLCRSPPFTFIPVIVVINSYGGGSDELADWLPSSYQPVARALSVAGRRAGSAQQADRVEAITVGGDCPPCHGNDGDVLRQRKRPVSDFDLKRVNLGYQ